MEHISCKRCVFEVLCLVCPLVIVLLWLLSIWKNMRANKPHYWLSRLESVQAAPYCCNVDNSCFLPAESRAHSLVLGT